ncbi:hypothetical protein [Pseudomonas extremaustralis]
MKNAGTLKARLDQIVLGSPASTLEAFDWTRINEAAKTKSADLITEEASLSALMKDEHRQVMHDRVQCLQAKQWLSQNKTSISAERTRLIAVAAIDKASRSAATNALTTKKNDLAKTELDAGYQARFIEELKLLGGHRIPIAPLSKSGGKGKITFGLNLVGAHGSHGLDYILSEGETRIAALAADSTTLGHSAHDHLDTRSMLTWTPDPRPLGQAVGAQRRRFALLV